MSKSTIVFHIKPTEDKKGKPTGKFYATAVAGNGEKLNNSESLYNRAGAIRNIEALRKRIIETQDLPLEAIIKDFTKPVKK